MPPLSVCITTYNNDDTLANCLQSVFWADEIIVLDSFSTDKTQKIANEFQCTIHEHRFLGYSRQKQMAIDLAKNDWVLLLDADEALSSTLQTEIRSLMQPKSGPQANGCEFPRQEQMFWQMASTTSRLNYFMRLFRKSKGKMNDIAIHAAPTVTGDVIRLKSPFYHFGEPNIDTKVGKLNYYSTGMVEDRVSRGKTVNPWSLIYYPPLVFLRSYFWKRNFVNGWAGFIGSVCMAFYAFMKYAKVFEHQQHKKLGHSLMPDCYKRSLERAELEKNQSEEIELRKVA